MNDAHLFLLFDFFQFFFDDFKHKAHLLMVI